MTSEPGLTVCCGYLRSIAALFKFRFLQSPLLGYPPNGSIT